MVNRIGAISGIIVVVIIVCVMNHYSTPMTSIISTMMIVIIVMINTDSHNGKSSKIRRMIYVSIRRIIRYIYRRIHILNNWS